MEHRRVIDISGHQSAVKQHGKEYQECDHLPSGQSFLGQSIGKAHGDQYAAGGSDDRQNNGNAIRSQDRGTVRSKHPFICISAPLLR